MLRDASWQSAVPLFIPILNRLAAELKTRTFVGLINNREVPVTYLGFATHDIPVLVSKGLLKPLGHPGQNGVKYFALSALGELRQDTKWLARASDAITEHWKAKNARARKSRRSNDLDASVQGIVMEVCLEDVSLQPKSP